MAELDVVPADLFAFRELVRRRPRATQPLSCTSNALQRVDAPLFDGLPCRGLPDPVFYRDFIPSRTFDGQGTAQVLEAGAVAVPFLGTHGCYSGTLVAVRARRAGQPAANMFPAFDDLSRHPAADGPPMNTTRHAMAGGYAPPADLPPGFTDQLLVVR